MPDDELEQHFRDWYENFVSTQPHGPVAPNLMYRPLLEAFCAGAGWASKCADRYYNDLFNN